MARRDISVRLFTPLSQMAFASDDEMMAYIIDEREEARLEIARLVRSRNHWGQKYNKLLAKVRGAR